MARYLYSELSALLANRSRMDVDDKIERLVEDHMPSGSGIDSGTKLDMARSHADKLVFTFGYHHMDDNGYYCGWTEHTCIVTPSLRDDYNMRITGRDRNSIKEYLADTFSHALQTDVEWDIIREYPRVKEMGLNIKYVWKDQCTGEMLVIKDGVTLFNGNEAARGERYKGSPMDLCKAFCVEYVRSR